MSTQGSTPNATIHPIYVRVTPADIALVKFLFESYEGVGIVRTVDRQAAIIVVLVAADFRAVARDLLAALHAQIAITEVAPPGTDADDWLMREIDSGD